MSCQVFYRKWRPQNLAEVVGQEPITTTLLSALKQRRVAQAYLFCGPRGTGKTSTGRILAKAVNCLTNDGLGEPCNTCEMCRGITEGRAMDVIEIDAASNTGVDDIRELKERVNYAPAEARYKVYIIDEVHMLSTSASNALLKTLEEPPPRVIFILATTELHKILPTIMSRCQRFDFRRLTVKDIAEKLAEIAKAEGIDIEKNAVALLARSASGSLRDAENLLQQIATVNAGRIGLRQVQSGLGLTGDDRSSQLVKLVVAGDIAGGLKLLSGVAADGIDLKQFNREVTESLRQLLMVKAGSADAAGLSAEELADLKTVAESATLEQIMKALKGFSALSSGADMTTPLAMEMALVDATLKLVALEKAAEAPVEPARGIKTTAEPAPRKPVSSIKPLESTLKTQSRAENSVQPPAPPKPPESKPEPTQQKPGGTGKSEPAPAPKPANVPITTLEDLVSQWPGLLTAAPPALRRSTALAILRSAGAQPVAYSGGVITLAFKFPIHMNKINEPENKRVTGEILSACVGTPCQVACVHEQVSNHLVKEAQKRGAEIINVEDKWISQK
ncbi:DNA polymerase III subunit gamma/tau [Dehalogenimonas etheniformans]|uniref:DNA polymerase III subunit gamma/tau n=1 Tax=Dehalogenimonas etheniformans TaxID=1536648 RepID=A0A2P5P607_9CHLR|nr:DNA polymerase III subunit gamma/tau [Dehalogenimonas etheniformans]PPD57709.1 DNA polymerase III subunit gamma/tau [Dehalogenimonas etheniformans]QNT76049.1 DNA polymerase III subunit gamma/tau [Dehalogenimonas etheniformans]